MCHYLSFIFYLMIIGNSLALEYSGAPLPHSDCPNIDDVNHAVMLPYPQDCSKYYSCLNGLAYLQQCPNNLHWSPLTYRCDYPEVAKCQNTLALPIPNHINNQPSTAELMASPTGDIVYELHPKDCSKYYKCKVLICPTNYHWNSQTQKCDFPHDAHCPFLREINELDALNSSPSLHSLALNMGSYRGDFFTLQYPRDCAKFYQCQSMSCPANYHWNLSLQQCNVPQSAQCTLRPKLPSVVATSTSAVPTAFTAPPTTSATTQSHANDAIECSDCVQRCDGYLHHYLPHPSDCHKFIQCNGWSFIHTCPDNLFWNAKLKTCDRMCVAS